MEKRRRAVHLLKEGLVPHSDVLSKRMGASQKIKTEIEEIPLEQEIKESEIIQTITEREVLNKESDPLESSYGPVCDNEIANNSGSLATSVATNFTQKKTASLPNDMRSSSLNPCANDQRESTQSTVSVTQFVEFLFNQDMIQLNHWNSGIYGYSHNVNKVRNIIIWIWVCTTAHVWLCNCVQLCHVCHLIFFSFCV